MRKKKAQAAVGRVVQAERAGRKVHTLPRT